MGILGTTVVVSAPNNQPLPELKMVQNNSLLTTTQVEGKSELLMEIESVAEKYQLNKSRFTNLIKCESSFNKEAVGDHGLAYSLLQFHKATFNQYCEGDYYNYSDQLECGARMISEGLAKHWSCSY